MSGGTNKKRGFTIVELLVVISIIIVLMSVLVPILSMVRRYAKVVTQKGQFHEISKGLELYHNDHAETYPDSSAVDSMGLGYCGAMRLCETMIGQDGMGFNLNSKYMSLQPELYLFDFCTKTDPSKYTGDAPDPCLVRNLQERVKYMDPERIKSYRIQDIYSWDLAIIPASYYRTAFFTINMVGYHGYQYSSAVIGDVFLRADIKSYWCPSRAGQKVGMPVLYYKADPSKQIHDISNMYPPPLTNPNIYNFDDNYGITNLGCPWEGGIPPTTLPPTATVHPMAILPDGPLIFYNETINTKVTATPRPHNEDGYILMSAGWDGLYGTRDDVFNFSD
jgi:prepilin-type N-terminal cleavage/methylation domain-containing protein